MAGQAAARHLTAAELGVCEQTGTDPAAFVLQKLKRDRLGGKALMMAVPHSRSESVDLETDPSALVKYAMDEMTAFLKAPEQLDSLEHLANAKAYLSRALALTGGGSGRSADDWT